MCVVVVVVVVIVVVVVVVVVVVIVVVVVVVVVCEDVMGGGGEMVGVGMLFISSVFIYVAVFEDVLKMYLKMLRTLF